MFASFSLGQRVSQLITFQGIPGCRMLGNFHYFAALLPVPMKKEEKHYKFKSLITYNPSRTKNTLRRPRMIFDRQEINYLNVAMEFYNKWFDEKDWETEITFKAYWMESGKKGKEVCSQTQPHKVLKEENIVVVDFGWGADEYGKFWQFGAYEWEVFIGKDLFGTAKFYIEDAGVVTIDDNPYFQVASLKTYESPAGNIDEDDRIYYKVFSKAGTRYVMSELNILNKLEEEWLCEVFFNYFDDTGVLIGTVDSTALIKPNIGAGEFYTITGGWGSAKQNSWQEDNYRIEVVFMDTVVAIIPFTVGDKFVERNSLSESLLNREVGNFYSPPAVEGKGIAGESATPKETEEHDEVKPEAAEADTETGDKPEEPVPDNRPLNEILGDLDRLIGLETIKQKVREYVDYVTFIQYRQEKGLDEKEEIKLHSLFTGNPGTGKTTVVKLLGKLYHSMGLLSKGHVHAVESSDLISQYVRQTGQNTKDVIEKARGGILFIDEAYMLYKEDAPTDFGPEAIAALITEMSDGAGDIAIMMAGYPKEMETLIHSNPGLKSRIANYFHFEDYTPDELLAIGIFAACEKGVELSEKALKRIKKLITDAYRRRDRTFGNARFVNALIDEAKMNLGIRLVRKYHPDEMTAEMLTVIHEEDIEDTDESRAGASLKLDIDQPLLEEALAELNGMTGLRTIKQEVHELIRLTKYYKEMNRDILKAFSLHSVFLGNPGTGKTTVARILGKIYKALGLLERGHLIDADSSDLIAGYVGKTALKTKELVNSAMGGILFIDEAYAISEGSSGNSENDFGKQAIAALIKEMEDHRGEFGVIVSGYPDNMQRFLEANPGMKSRFDMTFNFSDFSEEELAEIALRMFEQKRVHPDQQAETLLRSRIAEMVLSRNKFFGNARSIRKLVERAYRNLELRMADLPVSSRTPEAMSLILPEDLPGIERQESPTERPRIGFTFGSR